MEFFIMKKLENMVGQTFLSNHSGYFTIIEYNNKKDVTVRFINTGYITKTQLGSIRRGEVLDPYAPRVYGVGITGTKYPCSVNGCVSKEYSVWCDMLKRCYDPKEHARYPGYIDCTVSDNFRYYEYFYEWCNNQIGFNNPDWHLDKDLLFKGNKVYSENTCVFLPAEINVALTNSRSVRGLYPAGVTFTDNRYVSRFGFGKKERTTLGRFTSPIEAFNAYKQAKENYLVHLAYLWECYIDPRAFEALLYYSIDIND